MDVVVRCSKIPLCGAGDKPTPCARPTKPFLHDKGSGRLEFPRTLVLTAVEFERMRKECSYEKIVRTKKASFRGGVP
jgi:hypothetical protein